MGEAALPFDEQTDPAHRSVVCPPCRRENRDCRPAAALIQKLNEAVSQARASGADDIFEVFGIACMAGWSRPRTVACLAVGRASYLFSDIDPDRDIPSLVAFAAQYRPSEDGGARSTERPGGLRNKTLARLPGCLIMTRNDTGPSQ